MHRRERAKVVILSSEETYCYAKAVFDPVMENLASLATPAFVTALKSWKDIVRSGLETVEADSTTRPDETEESDDPDTSDTSSDITPADLIDTMNFIRELEQDKAGSNDTALDSKRESAVDKNEATLAATPTPSKAASGTMSAPTLLVTKAASPSTPKLYPTKAVSPAKKKRYPVKATVRVTTRTKVVSKGGILVVLRIPKKPKVRHSTRTKLKQTKLSKGAKPQKLAAIVLSGKIVPEILANDPTIIDDDFMNSRVARSKRDHVYTDNYDYNFVIPKNLILKLDAVVKAEKKKRSKSNYFNQTADDNHPERTTDEIIAYFPSGTPEVTSAAVYRMNEFYNVVRKLDAWKEDVD
ncbi:hypothetical protein PF011_g14015 [Phytophthora fragariae]|uniref:Uncharacterized protein n=1 Tax=Phytophthora fragariae TaxID=53985 RepID=A0A6A3K5I8_9STRA|nr:hypothetical protein PF011_g14015 [Phytophthora fragariae]